MRALLISLLLVGGLTYPGISLPVAKAPFTGGDEPPRVRVEEGRVSVKIAGASLAEVLREIIAQSPIRLILHGSRQEEIFAEFQAVPLDDALRRLIKTNFLFVYAPGTAGPLVEVWVWGVESPTAPPPSAAHASAQPRRAGETESLDSLIEDLHRGDAKQRGRAVLWLGEFKDERALQLVLWAFEGDEDPEVRQRAVWALEDLGGPRAMAALADAASGDPDDSVRRHAVEGLATMGGHEAVEPLTRALSEDPDPFVRYQALVNLTEIGGDRVRDLLHQALEDPEELIWAKAAELLDIDSTERHEP